MVDASEMAVLEARMKRAESEIAALLARVAALEKELAKDEKMAEDFEKNPLGSML